MGDWPARIDLQMAWPGSRASVTCDPAATKYAGLGPGRQRRAEGDLPRARGGLPNQRFPGSQAPELMRTPVQFLVSLLVLLIVGLSTNACAGGSSGLSAEEAAQRFEAEMAAAGIYPETQPTRIIMKDHRSNVTIGVLNESHTQKSQVYSQVLSLDQPMYKIIPDLDMGALLHALGEEDFFAQARLGSGRIPGARMTVMVERDGAVHSLAFTTESDGDEIERVSNCSLAVRAMYDKHMAYQRIENNQGAGFFDAEQDRVRRQASNR